MDRPKNTAYLFALILLAVILGYWMPQIYEMILGFGAPYFPQW
jgi:hypothetical protein